MSLKRGSLGSKFTKSPHPNSPHDSIHKMPSTHNAAPITALNPDVTASPRLLPADPFFFADAVAVLEPVLVAAASSRPDVALALALAAAVLLALLLVPVVR